MGALPIPALPFHSLARRRVRTFRTQSASLASTFERRCSCDMPTPELTPPYCAAFRAQTGRVEDSPFHSAKPARLDHQGMGDQGWPRASRPCDAEKRPIPLADQRNLHGPGESQGQVLPRGIRRAILPMRTGSAARTFAISSTASPMASSHATGANCACVGPFEVCGKMLAD
jgi:hypothetical protein